MNREESYSLLCEYTKSESLIKHALAVEQAMKSYAQKFGEDETKWAIVGLLHDFDYEKYPTKENHPYKGAEILRQKNYTEDVIKAILGHATYTNVERDTLMAKTLFATDELCGFILACAYVMPDKKIKNLTVKSVRKKLKDKAFAKSVNRDDIYNSAKELGVELDEHIDFLIQSLNKISDQLGV